MLISSPSFSHQFTKLHFLFIDSFTRHFLFTLTHWLACHRRCTFLDSSPSPSAITNTLLSQWIAFCHHREKLSWRPSLINVQLSTLRRKITTSTIFFTLILFHGDFFSISMKFIREKHYSFKGVFLYTLVWLHSLFFHIITDFSTVIL